MNYPSTWETVTIGESLDLINGRAFKPKEWSASGRPIIRIQNLNNPKATFNYYTGSLPEKFSVAKGDLLFAWSGTPGTSFGAHVWKGPEAWLNQHIFKVVFPTAVFDKSFLQYAINQNLAQYIGVAHGGAGLAHITKGKFESSTLPLPPLPEQKRIVAKIEELFSELEAGEASLRKARRQLGVYRQSLLKQAFEGKLTGCQRVELVPLRDLITGLSQGWSPKCELNRTPMPDEWAIIKTTAIQHCHYDDSEAKPLPPPFKPRPSIEIKDGDFLMTRKGPRTRAGVSCYVRKTRPLLMVCDTVYRFRCLEARVHPLYLELALNSPDVLRAIDRQKAGISESGLSLTHTKIGAVEIPLCALPEQQEIVRILDKQFEAIERNERELDAALKRSEALRQSILKRAFSGRLVPQDPADEPAAAVLARLRAESRGIGSQRRGRKNAIARP